jgi:4-diphosphocytidyl-2-C-methyl-D-erythritol kinase
MRLAVTLHKNLPIASGIGGGSADAAAALRAAARFWHLQNHIGILEAAKKTGADVPACLLNTPCYFGGIGDEVTPIMGLPTFYLVLVNPNIPLPTADVFKAREGSFTPEARFTTMPATVQELAKLLAERRNDLQAAAIGLCAAVEHVLDALEAQDGCLLARMSGSGATCFGLFADKETAAKAADKIRHKMRKYWVAVSEVK